MKEIKAYVRTTRLPFILMGLEKLAEFSGMSVSEVRGFGGGPSRKSHQKMVEFLMEPNRHVKLEIVCNEDAVDGILATIREQAHTKEGSNGKFFVTCIDQVFPSGSDSFT